MFLLNIFIMMGLIKWPYAKNANMHCLRNGLRDILKMYIKLWYTSHLFFTANTNSLTKYNLAGLMNGCLKMMSRQWMSVRIGKLLLRFFSLRFLALKLSMLAAVQSAILWAIDFARWQTTWKLVILLMKMQSLSVEIPAGSSLRVGPSY